MTAPLNWRFHIECIDCGETYSVESVNPSIEVKTNRNGARIRYALLTIYNECPKCHNLRAVPNSEGA